jgi:hypothetical protein
LVDVVVLFGNLMLTDALPDVQRLVEGSPISVLVDEKRHFVAACTTAWRRTLPPDAKSVIGVAVKRAMLTLLRPTRDLCALSPTDTERVAQTEATRELCA